MLRAFGLGLACFLTWLLLSGHYTPLLVGLGLFSSVLVAWLAWRMDLIDDEGFPVEIIGRSLLYWPWLLWQIVLSNIDVAKRILDPKLPISPTLFCVKTSQRSDLGQVIYANSITLTPGTLSTYVGEHEIQVHALTREMADDLIAGEMDRRVTRLEGNR